MFLPDRDDEFLKRLFEMRLVVDEEGILAEERGVEGFGFEADSVAAEEEPAADHIDGPQDDGGSSGIGAPFAVIGELAAEGADREGNFGGSMRAKSA